MSIYDKSSLVLIPSGTKTGKVYSQKPTNGDGDFTFTRSSAATRVNADGNIEKETQNKLLYSNQFDTTWSFANANVVGGQSGYDGTNDAWLLTKTVGFGRVQRGVSVSGVHTASVYLKAGSLNWCRFLMLPVTSGTDPQVYINLSDGSLGSQYNNITATSTSVGNGWYRLTLTFQQAITEFRIYPAYANNNVSGTGSIYIQDAQVEQGLVARDYIETTTSAVYGGITDNVPRLDYTDSSCPALLLEPQRTNLIPNSEYIPIVFSPVNSNFTANSGISPEGVQNSTAVNVTSLSDGYCYYVPAVTDGVTYKFSAYYKGTAGESISMRTINAFTGDVTINTFTLTGNWQREEVNLTAGSSTNLVYLYDGRVGGLTATDFEVWGAQLEAGSYATSYIPTYGSSVSRVAETCSKTSATDLIGQNEGSFYAEIDFTDTDTDQMYMTLSDGTSNNRIHIGYDYTSDFIYCNIRVAGSAQGLITTPTSPSDGIKKIAVAYAQDDYVMYINGTQVGSDANANVPTLNRIDIGNYWATGYEYPVKQNLLFKTRLTNAELADLTTL